MECSPVVVLQESNLQLLARSPCGSLHSGCRLLLRVPKVQPGHLVCQISEIPVMTKVAQFQDPLDYEECMG
jgi:hypothetical protein